MIAVPGGAGVLDAALGGQGVGGLVQHDLHHRPASGGQQFPGDEELRGAGLVLAADYPAFGPVVASQLVTLRGALLVRPGPGHDHHIGHVRVLILDRGPSVFKGGDDPAVRGPVMAARPFFSVCMPTSRQGEGWGRRAGWGRLLPARFSWPRVRRGSARKGWGALAGEGRARTRRGPHPERRPAEAFPRVV